MTTLYKAGYYVFVRSWENDGDNYNSETISVDTKEKAILLGKFFSLFKNNVDDGGIGNICEDDDSEQKAANKIIKKFSVENPEFTELFNVVPTLDGMRYWINEAGLSSEYLTRVAEEVEVRYFPNDVEYEIVE